jgi:tungstate transport system permease protein
MNDFSRAFSAAIELLLSGDAELIAIVVLSIKVSLSAAVIGFVLGAPCGAALALWRFPGRRVLIAFANALLGLPPVVVGLFVYLMLTRSGPLGSLGWLFTPAAMILAQTILTMPIIVALSHRACEAVWGQHGDSLRIAGATRFRALPMVLAMARTGLVTAFIAAFGRAIAEVGAIIIVGGNIRGYTRTMTTSIALETSRGELALALGLGLILIAISLAVSASALLLAPAEKR